jgi:hypothetical protein
MRVNASARFMARASSNVQIRSCPKRYARPMIPRPIPAEGRGQASTPAARKFAIARSTCHSHVTTATRRAPRRRKISAEKIAFSCVVSDHSSRVMAVSGTPPRNSSCRNTSASMRCPQRRPPLVMTCDATPSRYASAARVALRAAVVVGLPEGNTRHPRTTMASAYSRMRPTIVERGLAVRSRPFGSTATSRRARDRESHSIGSFILT